MVQNMSATWKAKLDVDFSNEIRAYIDPRMVEYPPIAGTDNYDFVTSSELVPGDWYLTQSTYYTHLAFSYPITFECLVKPGFAYNVVSDQEFFKWHNTEAAYVTFIYSAASDKIGVKVYDTAGSVTLLELPTVYDGATLVTWKRLTCTITASAITLYLNGAGAVTTARDFTVLKNLPRFYPCNNIDLWMSYALIIPGIAATATDIGNFYKTMLNEQIYFPFQKNAVGRTRCDVTKYVSSYAITEPAGYLAAEANVSINSVAGEFCADQYASYEPQSGSYNGTVAQKYLGDDIGISLYQMSGDYTLTIDSFFEPLFIGTVKAGTFSRSTSWGGIGELSFTAMDYIRYMGTRVIKNAKAWQDYYFSRTTPASNSLLHEICYLATKRSVFNYSPNSGFENASIEWIPYVGTTVARSNAHALAGTYSAKLTGLTGMGMYYKFLSYLVGIGNIYTWQVWAWSDVAQDITMTILAHIGDDVTTSTASHNGLGWQLFHVSHTIITAATGFEFKIDTTGTELYVDCAMLTCGGVKNYYIENTYDPNGKSYVSEADAVEGKYEMIGIDAENVTYQHPWAIIKKGESVWTHLKYLAEATIARLMHIAKPGYFIYRSNMTSDLSAVSEGNIPDINGLSMLTGQAISNKLTVRGVMIIFEERDSYIWSAKAAGVKDDNANDDMFKVTLADGQYFPSKAYFESSNDPLECLYGLDDDTVKSGSSNAPNQSPFGSGV